MITADDKWSYNHELTAILNEPGISVLNTIDEEPDTYHAIMDITYPPRCPQCEEKCEPSGYTPERILYDVLDDGRSKKTVKLLVKRRRYSCPHCARHPELSYTNGIYNGKQDATKRLKDWIGEMCITYTLKQVSERLGGKIKKSTIGEIFAEWSREKYAEYTRNLSAPRELGVHLITYKDRQYYVLSDLANKNIIDCFKVADPNSLVISLLCLVMQERIIDVCTTLNPSTLAMVRDSFKYVNKDSESLRAGKLPVTLRASTRSLLEEYSKTFKTIVEMVYTGPGKNQLMTYVSSVPFNDLGRDARRKSLERVTKTETSILKDAFNAQEYLRIHISLDWSAKVYDGFLQQLTRYPRFKNFCAQMNLSKLEIQNSFTNLPIQEKYDKLGEDVWEVIDLNQRFEFDQLRAKILFTIKPRLESRFDRVTKSRVMFHTGIPVDELLAVMKSQNQQQ